LQEIQPQLSGVFAGTLAGIGGSLIAALGGLLLDRVALSTANRAQDFIHRHIIPTLPERRIAIKIEDAVLAMIAERAQVVAESLRLAGTVKNKLIEKHHVFLSEELLSVDYASSRLDPEGAWQAIVRVVGQVASP
jgi:hypothetical protein